MRIRISILAALLAALGLANVATASCHATASQIADILFSSRGDARYGAAFEVPVGGSAERTLYVTDSSADVYVVPCPLVRSMSFTLSADGRTICSGTYEGDPGASVVGGHIGPSYPRIYRNCAMTEPGPYTLSVRMDEGVPGASVAVRVF